MTDLSPRIAGRRGGGRTNTRYPQLQLSNFRTGTPVPPPSGDVTYGITDWGMDHNDQWSCCGPAATDHYQVAKAGDVSLIDHLGGSGVLPLYFEYGIAQGEPGPYPDQGVDNGTWLKFLFDKGIIEAFAELDPNNADEVHQGMLDFGGVLTSVSLTADAEQLFGAHQPWTVASGEMPDPSMGHDILLAKYGPEGDTFVTWGALQLATVAWDSACITGAWVIVTSEDAARTGVDIAALKAKITALGGSVASAPAPTPPVPGIMPPSEVVQWFRDFLAWFDSL